MSGEERPHAGPGSAEEDREREEEARRARATAEGERAAAERDAERGEDDEGVLPADADEERRSVVRPPAGAGPE
jgi:hypothetical protein